jgi:hypothetical protein
VTIDKGHNTRAHGKRNDDAAASVGSSGCILLSSAELS